MKNRSRIKDYGINSKTIDVRPLDQRMSRRKDKTVDAREVLLFQDELLPDLDTDLASLLPDYEKKRLKLKIS
jgi:hypothetical protein